jgi:hypothetical protein
MPLDEAQGLPLAGAERPRIDAGGEGHAPSLNASGSLSVAAQDPHWIEYVGALGGLAGVVLAVVAAAYAKRSADSADHALSLARDEVGMARTEHPQFLRELRARARFRLSVKMIPTPGGDGVIREPATIVRLRLEVGLKNEGDRAAGETVLNVIAPRGLVGDFRWSGPQGELKPGASGPADAPETMTDADGKDWPAHYLALTIPRVTRRSPVAAFATMTVEVPRQGDVRSVPLRVTADADELPEGEPEASEKLMVRVALPERT